MNDILEIINSRSLPGVLIVDTDLTLLYANKEVLGIIQQLWCSTPTPDGKDDSPSHWVLDEILSLCDLLKADTSTASSVEGKISLSETSDDAGAHYCLRAFYLDKPVEGTEGRHIMVLVERVIAKHEVDLRKAQNDYLLSKREVDILECICRGLTNKEIAEAKFICEYTVKDHIKKIMRNMGVNSRSEILAALR
jgi:DNA-binding CsgD family transcriptional regulator